MFDGESPPIPRFELSRARRLRHDFLESELLLPFYGSRLVGENLPAFAHTLSGPLKADPVTIEKSLVGLIGRVLTEEAIQTTVLRLTGNLPKLKQGIPVPTWDGVIRPNEWSALHVREVVRDRRRKGSYYLVRYRVLAGQACPHADEFSWSRALIQRVARELGYTSNWKDRPFRSIYELTNLRFYALLRQEWGRIQVDRLFCPAGAMTWNRVLIDQRNPATRNCPHQFEHHCFQCHIGYDDCRAPTLPTTVHEDAAETPEPETCT